MNTVALLGLIALVLYIGACILWPYSAHRWCKGSGRRRSPTGKAWRACGGCEGTGRRVRLGRRIYEALRTTEL